MIFENFFKSLGVDENASVEEKRAALRKKLAETFPGMMRPTEEKAAEASEEKVEVEEKAE